MVKNTAFADSMQTLYALELKNKLYECLLCPSESFDVHAADKYYRELLDADPDGEILDAPLLELYRKRKKGACGIKPVREPLTAVRSDSEKRSRIVLICAAAVAFAAIIMIIGFKTDFFGLAAPVTPPMRVVDDDSPYDRDWSNYCETLKIACSDLDMQIKFPKWLPPEMKCSSVSEYAFDDSYTIDVMFFNCEENCKEGKPLRNVFVLIEKNFESNYNRRSAYSSIMPEGTHYKIEAINGIEYYIMAEENGCGYVAYAVDGEYSYRIDMMCDYQTVLKILDSVEPL